MRCFNVKHCCVLMRLCVCGVIVCVSWKPLGCPDHLLWWPSGFLGHPGLFQWPQTEIWSFQLQNPKKQGNTWLTRRFYNACFFLALKWYTVKKKHFIICLELLAESDGCCVWWWWAGFEKLALWHQHNGKVVWWKITMWTDELRKKTAGMCIEKNNLDAFEGNLSVLFSSWRKIVLFFLNIGNRVSWVWFEWKFLGFSSLQKF